MAERVSHDDVRYVASLARLALDTNQVDKFARELSGILDHMDVLARVDTSNVAPFVQHQLEAMPLREDSSGTSTPLAIPLDEVAPQLTDRFFLVPRLATHEGESHS